MKVLALLVVCATFSMSFALPVKRQIDYVSLPLKKQIVSAEMQGWFSHLIDGARKAYNFLKTHKDIVDKVVGVLTPNSGNGVAGELNNEMMESMVDAQGLFSMIKNALRSGYNFYKDKKTQYTRLLEESVSFSVVGRNQVKRPLLKQLFFRKCNMDILK